MPFYRFEQFKAHHLNPHLSTGEGPVIEGRHMYFRIVSKRAGTGSEPHYHPNELMTFPLSGRINCMVGNERRIVEPGMFVHIPPYARHSLKATEDADLHYLYIKDRTWTLIGSAADEALPDAAPSAPEIAQAHAKGLWPGKEKTPERSEAIVEGLGRCFYPMIEGLDAPHASGHSEQWIEGKHLAFGFVESPPGHETAAKRAARELFAYVIDGALDAEIDGERKRAGAGDILHVPQGKDYRWAPPEGCRVRYAAVRSTERLEQQIARSGAADNWRG